MILNVTLGNFRHEKGGNLKLPPFAIKRYNVPTRITLQSSLHAQLAQLYLAHR